LIAPSFHSVDWFNHPLFEGYDGWSANDSEWACSSAMLSNPWAKGLRLTVGDTPKPKESPENKTYLVLEK
jgi:hypothetical protein